MGHYLSEMTGPPFQSHIELTLTKKMIDKLMRSQKLGNRRFVKLIMEICTVHRRDDKASFSLYYGSHFFTFVTEEEVRKALYNVSVNQWRKELTKKCAENCKN